MLEVLSPYGDPSGGIMTLQRIKDFRMDFGEHRGIACTAPCSMYSVLIENNLIPDPFYGDNERRLRDLARQGVSFTAEFDVDAATLARREVLIRFASLDTLCRISVNGNILASVDNMHRTYYIDVKKYLTVGINTLRLDFSSALIEMEKKQAERFLFYDLNCTSGHSHLRKAYYMSGWDWAPTLSDMGIMRDVDLISYDGCMIDRVELRQHHTEGAVDLDITLHTRGTDDMARAVATLVSPGGVVYYCGLVSGKGRIHITDPNLWWPNGLGPQNLYKLSVNLYSDTELVDGREMRVGLRTLTVSRDKDEYGEEFALTVNGVKFFAMGANYVPEDSIIPRLSKERTRKILTSARDANFNTLRVWGGAFYPTDWFYDLCDELGLVVWQDFMVACGNIWLTEHNRENFIAEFIDNFTRIGYHASLGIVSGNNEMEEFVTCDPNFDGVDVRRDYLELYENILPALMREYLPDTFYWPSSPSSGGGFDDPRDESRGDSHYWRMWSGGEPYEDCRNHYFRFMSEYGFESFPNIKTVRAFAAEEDMNVFSPVVEWHQKKRIPDGNKMMLHYAAGLYRYAHSFPTFVYMSQLVQADAIRYTAEHMRRNRGRCMGSIYWQFNDCWPVASWSSVDYFGRWKALHYAAKKFYAPVLISACEEGTRVKFNLSNERRKPFNGRFTYSVIDTSLRIVFKDTFEVSVPPMTAMDIHTAELESIMRGHEDEYIITYGVSDGAGAKSDGTTILVKPKAFKLPKPEIRYEISGSGCDYTVTLTTDAYARSVELDFETVDAVFEDNYFDLTALAPVRISFKTSSVTNVQTLRREMRIRTVYDIGR